MPYTISEHGGHTNLVPQNIIDACLLITGEQGGTWSQHERDLVWQPFFWRSRVGMEYRWHLLHKRPSQLACQGNIVATWIGAKRKDAPPAIESDMARDPKVRLTAFPIMPHTNIEIMPHDARAAVAGITHSVI